jgi:hypothetical protein
MLAISDGWEEDPQLVTGLWAQKRVMTLSEVFISLFSIWPRYIVFHQNLSSLCVRLVFTCDMFIKC